MTQIIVIDFDVVEVFEALTVGVGFDTGGVETVALGITGEEETLGDGFEFPELLPPPAQVGHGAPLSLIAKLGLATVVSFKAE